MPGQPAAPTAPAAAPAAPAAATPASGAAPPAPAAASPPAAPAKPVVLSEAAKRQQAIANLEKARAAKAAKAAGAPAAPPAAPAATGQAPAVDPAASTEPKGLTVAQLAAQNRKLERTLAELKANGDATKPELELLAALRDPSKRWDALNKVGVKYDEWTAQLLQAAGVQTEAPAEPVHPEVAKLRAELDELKGKATSAEQQAQAAIAERDQVRRTEYARQIVTGGGDKYAITAALGREGDLLLEHERMVREDAIDKPDPQLVAANVEKLHETALRKQLGALIATAKGKALIAELLGVQATATPAEETAPKAAPVPTNGLSGERSPNGLPADFYKWSDRQKREWAMGRANKRASA